MRVRDSHTINCVHENQKQLGGNRRERERERKREREREREIERERLVTY